MAAAIGLLMCMRGVAQAEVHAFLRLSGMTGESQDPNHAGWLDISLATANITNSVSVAPPRTNAPALWPLGFSKPLDRTTPALLLACAKGSTITNGTLDITPDNTSRSFAVGTDQR